MQRKYWTQQEDEILKATLNDKNALLSLLPDRTWAGILGRINNLKLKRGGFGWSSSQIEFLRENYASLPKEEILKGVPCSNWHAVQEYARKRGLTRQKNKYGKYLSYGKKGILQPLLDGSLQSAYWLGYLLADGYMFHKLSQIVLVSALADKDHMEKYASFLNSTAKVYDVSTKSFSSKDGIQVRVSVAEKGPAEEIARMLDWKKQKTYNPPDPKIIENNFAGERLLALIVGFIDGDGYIRPEQIKVETHPSWYEFHKFLASFLESYFPENKGITKVVFSKRGYVSLLIRNKTVLAQIKQFINKNNIVHLDRKWAKINEHGQDLREKRTQTRKTVLALKAQGLSYKQISEQSGVKMTAIGAYMREKK